MFSSDFKISKAGAALSEINIPNDPFEEILKNLLLNNGIKSVVYSSFMIPGITKNFDHEEAKEAMNHGHIVILVGGTGNPYFTTDTTAVLRALELECDVLLKGTKVDGVYDKDPEKYSKAKKFSKLDFKRFHPAGSLGNKLKTVTFLSLINCRTSGGSKFFK